MIRERLKSRDSYTALNCTDVSTTEVARLIQDFMDFLGSWMCRRLHDFMVSVVTIVRVEEPVDQGAVHCQIRIQRLKLQIIDHMQSSTVQFSPDVGQVVRSQKIDMFSRREVFSRDSIS